MYYCYVLKSLVNSFLYVGSAKNLLHRLSLHNSGRVKSTRPYSPWVIVETKEFKTRGEAQKYEYFLKSGQQKEALRKKYC